MSKMYRASSRLLLNVAILVVVSLFFAPMPVVADTMVFMRTADQDHLFQSSCLDTSNNKACLDLDDDGNVMVRYSGMSVTFIYETGENSQKNRIESGNYRNKEVACLGGLSVKLGVTF